MVTIRWCQGSAGTPVSLALPRFFDGRTQWMVLSAAINNPAVRSMMEGPRSMLGVIADDNIGVTVDGEVVVGRRSRHRAGVLRHRPRGPVCSQASRPAASIAVLAEPRGRSRRRAMREDRVSH